MCALSRMAFLVWAPIQRSTSGIDEETVSKTAAPSQGVQSAILWCSAISLNPVIKFQQRFMHQEQADSHSCGSQCHGL